MTNEQQVCTLQQALHLKELGVKQDGFFAYFNDKGVKNMVPFVGAMTDVFEFPDLEIVCSAFTAAELGQKINWDLCSITTPYKDDKKWGIHFNQDSFSNENETVVRADALIYLLERGGIYNEQVVCEVVGGFVRQTTNR